MNPLATVMGALIRAYQLCVSPFMAPRCRFLPTCSDYAHEALHVHGIATGGWLALRRLCRCHPWGGSGYDPIPEVSPSMASSRGTPTSTRAISHLNCRKT